MGVWLDSLDQPLTHITCAYIYVSMCTHNACTDAHIYTHHTHMYVYTRMPKYIHMHVQIHAHTRTSGHTHVHTHVYMHVHMHTHTHVYRHPHTHACTHTYTHSNTSTCPIKHSVTSNLHFIELLQYKYRNSILLRYCLLPDQHLRV